MYNSSFNKGLQRTSSVEHLTPEFRAIVKSVINSKPLCTEAIATSSSEGDRRYILHPIEAGPASSTRGSTYTILEPRLMFHGLPQLSLGRFPQLNDVRYQLKYNTGRYDVKYFPISFKRIMKKEKWFCGTEPHVNWERCGQQTPTSL